MVLRVIWSNEKARKKAQRMVDGFEGVHSFTMDMNDKTITVTGDMDTVLLVKKLRKKFPMTDIVHMSHQSNRENRILLSRQSPPSMPSHYGTPYHPGIQNPHIFQWGLGGKDDQPIGDISKYVGTAAYKL